MPNMFKHVHNQAEPGEHWWVLIGPRGAVQFAAQEPRAGGRERWKPIDRGYHSPHPRYTGQRGSPCRWLDGERCYYDGSSTHAQQILDAYVAEGEAAIWRFLEADYRWRFEQIDMVDTHEREEDP